LNQAETGSRTVSDPQAVVLAQGFSASSNVSNPFIAKIGASSENNPTNPTNSDAGSTNPSGTVESGNFHDTRGNIDVNGGGQLQYTLPIALPPGVKSVAPQVNLVYTSGSGNGIAGYGWSISGVTAISRMGRTLDRDEEVRGVKLDYSDFYNFNGQRLLLKSGEYGKDGAEYVTEKYSNIKIKSLGSVNGQQWQGPEYWEVTFEDGSQAWYGATTSGASTARTPMEYNMVKWKDAQGNYITYNYTQTSNVALISSIQYGGNETLSKSHFNELIFTYATRLPKEVSYSNGILFEQTKLLVNVQVKTNGNQFKRYGIEYENSPTINGNSNNTINYKFVKSIKEYGSTNALESNPVNFTTNALTTKTEERAFVDFNDIVTSGDYNGDGLIDYIVKQPSQSGKPEGYYLYFDAINAGNNYVYLGLSSAFPASSNFHTFNIKPADNIVKAKQGLLIVRHSSTNNPPQTNNIELTYYNIKSDASVLNTTNNPLVLEYSKIIQGNNYAYDDGLYPYQSPPDYNYLETVNKSSLVTTKEIDINSDGLSETVMAIQDSKCYQKIITEDPLRTLWSCTTLGYRYIVVDNQDLASNTHHTIAPTTENILSKGSIMDFDNNGVQDVMFVKNTGSNVTVSFYTRPLQVDVVESTATPVTRTHTTPINNVSQYEIKKIGNSYNITLKNVFQIKGLTDGIKFADLNGDKNIEILAPIHYNNAESGDYYNTGWSFYLNKGTSTLVEDIQGFTYNYKEGAPGPASYNYSYSAILDMDNDGKSEFVNMYNSYAPLVQKSHTGINLFSEFKYDPAQTQIKWSYKNSLIYKEVREKSILYPIYGDFRVNSSNSKILVISKSVEQNSTDKRIIFYYHYNLGLDKNIRSITQGGLTTTIDYKELDPSINPGLYASVKTEQYPYMELDKVSQSYAVSQLRQEGRKQDFKYRGFVTHLQGKGMLGFRQTARSSWYADGKENTIIWSGSEIDPLNDSVPSKEWTVKTYNDNSLIFPSDISENNNQLLSYKKTDYSTDVLANGVKATLPWKSKTKDFLKDITTDSEITYGDYYLPETTSTSINGGFATSETVMTYTHSPSGIGNDYYIGRPESKIESTTVYGNTKSTEESYDYSNNLLSVLGKKPSSSQGKINEIYQYDGWGNIIEKTVKYQPPRGMTPPSLIQSEKAQYDDKGRFVIKKTDNLNLETNITYNDWGQVLTQIDPSGVVLTNSYDGWGKLLTAKTNLAGQTSYTYAKDINGGSIVTQYDPDGNVSKKYTNKLGQEYKTQTKGLGQNTTKYIAKYKIYDVLGRVTQESEPYFDVAAEEAPSNAKWNTFVYDDTVFPAKAIATAFNGKQMETTVSGRTTTVRELNGNIRTTTKTTDVLGNVITSTDKGGTINFGYNAAGQQISAQYGNNTVTTAYDEWGRKIEFNDPSNGIYTYDYDGLGRVIRETSPKGTKEYSYNNFGQLSTQEEYSDDGTSTNKSITYSYNPKGLLISKQGISNGKAYNNTVSYDTYGRILSTSENSNGKYFMEKGITYDDKMRVTSYEKSLYSSGQYTKVVIENIYDSWSGDLYQVKDKTQNKVLWELQTTDANGQVINAKLGNTAIYNIYGSNNFIANATHKSISDNSTVLQLNYNFDAAKNELKSRTRGGIFNITENFEYDDNNRLVNWTDPVTGAFTQSDIKNTYDIKGRITNNDQVGEIKFNNSNKVYQSTGMVLNTAGQQNFNEKLLQKITYNENNDPIFIDGMKGDVAFTYGLIEMRQMATYGGNFDKDGEGKFTKYYSEDGSYEIVTNNQTGQEKHILYIGGTPYESNIVYLKNYAESTGSYKFLHKDYLGSILAITDETGNAVEQRHYDAWGNFTHLKINGPPMIVGVQQVTDFLATNSLLLDRGYTSHEHFSEVGLIHMNGRLYDPLLRRFLNADENIQDMFNTQNYNKYGYVLNNPLMYNDPSGEFFWIPIVAWVVANAAAIGTAALAGAIISMASAVIMAGLTGNAISAGGILKSAFVGAISGAVTFGIGSIFSVAGGSLTSIGTSIEKAIGGFGLTMVQAGTHAISQGVMSLVQSGGSGFLSGAISGFLGHMGAEAWGATMKGIGMAQFSQNTAGMVTFGALSGGIGSELSGGNFWQGAVTGGIVAGLNSAMHKIEDGPGKKKAKSNSSEDKSIFSTTVSVNISVPKEEFKNIKIITENNGKTFSPTKHGEYDNVDGVFLKDQPKDKTWYKASNFTKATIYYSQSKGLYIVNSTQFFNPVKLLVWKYYNGWVKNTDQVRIPPAENPFKKSK
jgi:RHS repeat-associated protein